MCSYFWTFAIAILTLLFGFSYFFQSKVLSNSLIDFSLSRLGALGVGVGVGVGVSFSLVGWEYLNPSYPRREIGISNFSHVENRIPDCHW